MNKLLCCILALSALMFSSCSEDEDDVLEGTVTFTASLENRTPSRTTVDIAGEQGIVKWATGDKISVVDSDNMFTSFTLSGGEGSTTGKFTGTFSAGKTGGSIAVYPAGGHKYNGTTLTVNLPASYGNPETEYTPDTHALMLANKIDNGTTLYFKHLCGMVHFTMDVPAGVRRVSLTGKGICGDFSVDPNVENPCIKQTEDAQDVTVSYNFKATESLRENLTFYFPIPAGKYTSFIISVSGKDGAASKLVNLGGEQSLNRANIVDCTAPTGPITGWVIEREWIDLGLSSGTLWAATNLGADSPADYGDYFAWGEVTARTANFAWAKYAWGKSSTTLTKYNAEDNETLLELDDDAAYKTWGNACLPTHAQIQELIEETDRTWTTKTNSYGESVNGYLFKGKGEYASRSIFLPAAGYRRDAIVSASGMNGYYWSANRHATNPAQAYDIYFHKTTANPNALFDRCRGCSVRPVFAPTGF